MIMPYWEEKTIVDEFVFSNFHWASSEELSCAAVQCTLYSIWIDKDALLDFCTDSANA